MADSKISALTSYTNPDPVNDSIPIVDNTNSTTKRISRNNLLGITSTPVGVNDIQTLTQKTLTSPTINGATLSGTISGTYTIGGTPTFPATVVTTTGSQTLTNKILTSPTINGPTITNASLTADAITGFTSANNGTIYGISVTSSQIGSAALATGAVTATKIGTDSSFAWSTWSPTVVGFASTTVAFYRYTQIGKIIYLDVDASGTSNSATTTITLPLTAKAITNHFQGGILWSVSDNGSVQSSPGRVYIDPAAPGTLSIGKNIAADTWTASGTKSFRFMMFYEAA